jgi:hypothetical protein
MLHRLFLIASAVCCLARATTALAQCDGPTFVEAWSASSLANGAQILPGDFRGTGGLQIRVS